MKTLLDMVFVMLMHRNRNNGLLLSELGDHVIALPVHLPDDERQLFLVVSRPGYWRKPWYLITTEPVYNAWKIIFAYARRWQIEIFAFHQVRNGF